MRGPVRAMQRAGRGGREGRTRRKPPPGTSPRACAPPPRARGPPAHQHAPPATRQPHERGKPGRPEGHGASQAPYPKGRRTRFAEQEGGLPGGGRVATPLRNRGCSRGVLVRPVRHVSACHVDRMLNRRSQGLRYDPDGMWAVRSSGVHGVAGSTALLSRWHVSEWLTL